MWPNSQFSADLVTFTEEIINGKLHFLCSVCCSKFGIACPRVLFRKLWKSSLFIKEPWVLYFFKEPPIWFCLNLVDIVIRASLEI